MHTANESHRFHGLPMGPVQALTDAWHGHEAATPQLDADMAGLEALAAMGLAVRPDTEVRQGFRIGALRLMIRYEDGSELTDLLRVHHLPNSPAWLLGVSNLHGLAIPVVALGEFLGVARDRAAAKPMLLVVERGADATGLVIDGLPARVEWGTGDLVDPGMVPPELRAFVRTACVIDDELWFDLDVRALLDEVEKAMDTAWH